MLPQRVLKLWANCFGERVAKLHIMFVLAGLSAGGAERVVSLISQEWARRGMSVSIVAFDAPSAPVFHSFHPDVRLIRLNIPPGGGSLLRGIRVNWKRLKALRHVFSTERPDVIVSFLTKVNVLSLVAGKRANIPVVISERNNPDTQRANPLWSVFWNMLSRNAAAIVLQTEAIRAGYPPSIANRATVIPNAVEIPKLKHEERQAPTVIAAGRLCHQKGFDLLISAFSQVSASHPDWILIIWGEGEDRAALEEQVRTLELEGKVKLPGTSEAPGGWINSGDVFVLSSRFEGFGNVLVEAMLAGLPVVSFECDFGPSEIVDDGVDGLLVAPENALKLAETLQSVLSDPALRSRLGAAAAISARRYSLHDTILKWDAVLDRVVYKEK